MTITVWAWLRRINWNSFFSVTRHSARRCTSVARKRHVSLKFTFRIKDGLDANHVQMPVTHARLNQVCQFGDAQALGDLGQVGGSHEKLETSVFRRKHGYIA